MPALSLESSNGVLYGTLVVILVSTVGIVLRKEQLVQGGSDAYLTARGTQGVLSLALSLFASGAGAWILFTVPEAAILGGPVAVFGYIVGSILPILIFACIAPYMRRNLPRAATFFEYVQGRYGTLVNAYMTLISLFYMFLFLSAEFKSLGDAFCWIAGGSANADPGERNCLHGPVVGTSIVTLLYTAIGGLPVSLLTDKVQGVGVFLFTLLVAIAAFTVYDLPKQSDGADVEDRWEAVTKKGINDDWGESVKMAVILVSAVTSTVSVSAPHLRVALPLPS